MNDRKPLTNEDRERADAVRKRFSITLRGSRKITADMRTRVLLCIADEVERDEAKDRNAKEAT